MLTNVVIIWNEKFKRYKQIFSATISKLKKYCENFKFQTYLVVKDIL